MITVLSMAYNEEFLLPFFLKHYDWVDKIIIFYDMDSTDKTLEILKSNSKVEIRPFKFPDGMDDIKKIELLTKEYLRIQEGWVLLVDIDEFIFANRTIINSISEYIPAVKVKFGNVYRHVSENDLDINLAIETQRRHGYFDPVYNKPIIVRAGLNISWSPGNHAIQGLNASDLGLLGAHWANADPVFCVDRRVANRSARQSKVNLSQGLTTQHHNLTVEKVLAECEKYSHAPLLW